MWIGMKRFAPFSFLLSESLANYVCPTGRGGGAVICLFFFS